MKIPKVDLQKKEKETKLNQRSHQVKTRMKGRKEQMNYKNKT